MRTRVAVAMLLAILSSAFLLTDARAQTSSPVSTSSLLVKVVGGMSVDQQAQIVVRNGGTLTSSIAALRLLVISIPTADLPTALATYQGDPQVQSVEENKVRVSEATPSDLLYVNQWALPKIGWDQVFGVIDPTGTAKVALLDTGVDATHPELADKVLPGTSILDGSNGMTDPSGHGTWLAGIIAAQTNTIPGDGIAAMAYAGVKILPVTVLNANGEGQDSDVIAGVIWAADHGADVVLMAFSNPGFSPNLQDAIDYAWSKNVVVVAAVGNNAASEPTFPAGDRGVMGVAATDQSDALASFSNAGQAVFIAAPGVEIQTIDTNGNYIVISGTSTSAAYVAGLAAFMKAVDPTLTNGVIVGRIARNADPAGTQDETGNGRINMPRALADTSTDALQPTGAAPVGVGGPFVGPYRSAAISSATTIVSAPTASGLGQSVTFTGTVTCNACTFTAAQTLSFVENANNSCNGGTPLSSGNVLTVTNNGAANATATATFTTSSLTTGTHAIRACLVGGGGSNPNPQNSNSAALNQVVSAAAKLAITVVNGGVNPTFGTAFSVVVESQTGSSLPANVVSATSFSLTIATGTGSIGTVNGTIAAGTNSVTVSGINYSKAENNVVLRATRTSGDTLTAGNSAAFNVLQASSTTTITCPPSLPYTGGAQTPCTVSVTGAGGLNLTPTPTYTNNLNAGTATASYTFAGDANHTGSSDTKTFTISQASSTTTVSCPTSVPYTGGAQTPCTVSVTGAGGLNLTPTPTYANNINAGTASASYTFAGDANHTGSSDSKTFTIEQASSTTTVSCPTSVPYTGDAQTPCTVSVTGAGGLNLTPTPTYANNINAGTASASYTFAGDTNHTGSSDSKNFTISQANSTTTVSCPASVTYDGSPQTPCTVSVTGAGGLNLTPTPTYANNINAGTASASYTFVGDANHTGSSDSKTFTIEQASSTTTVSCPTSVPYTGDAQTPCTVSVTGAGGLNLTPTPTYANNINAGTASASYTYVGDANHTGSSDSKTFTIEQASSTTSVVAGTTRGTYTATVSPVAPATTTPTGTVQFSIDTTPIGGPVSLDATGHATSDVLSTPGTAGSHTISAVYSGDTNYRTSTGTLTDAASAVANDAYATLQTSTLVVSTPGVLGNDSDADAGQTLQAFVTQPPAQGTLTLNPDGSFSYLPAPGGAGIGEFTFKYSVFDGVLYSPEATVNITVLAGNESPVALNDAYSVTTSGSLALPVIVNDYATATLTAAVVTNEGPRHGTLVPNPDGSFTYTPTPGFTGVDSFLYQASDGSSTSNVAMVTITVLAGANTAAVNDYHLTTDGTASGNALGNDEGNPTAGAVVSPPVYGTLSFLADGTFDYTPGLSFVGVDSFTYRASGGTNAGNLAMVTIRRPVITVSGGPVTYGSDATITVTVTIPGLGPVAGDVSLNAANATVAAPTTKTLDINGAATFTITQPTAAQSPHALIATYTSDGYNGSSTGTGSLIVNKATPVINWANPADITYGTALSSTQLNATATFNNTSVPGTFTYTPADGTVLNAGQNQTLHVAFVPTDSGNFNDASKDVSITVNKALLTVTATDRTKTYGESDPSFDVSYSGFVNGEGATVLGGTLTFNFAGKPPTSYGPSTIVPTDAGTYAIRPSGLTSDNYDITFKGGTYTINKAASTTVVTFEAGPYVYRATAFTATAQVTGVGGLNSPISVVYSGDCTNVTAANGCTATGTFGGDTNHLGSSDTKSITITQASSTTTVTFEAGPYVYRGTAFTATAVVTGVGGLNSPVPVVYSGDCTNVTAANGCTATATYGGDTNHLGSSDTKSITITQASSTTTVTFEAGPYVYRGTAFTATAVVTGVGGLNSPVPVVYSGDCTNVTAANGCTATATFGGDTNHLGSSASNSITITRATPTVSVTGGTFPYDGNAHPATGSVTGVNGANLGYPTFTYTPGGNYAPVNAGTYSVTASFAGNTNYNAASGGPATITIQKATPTVNVSGGTFTYDGNPHPATGSVIGVGGANLGTPTFIYTPGTSAPVNAGTYAVTGSFAGNSNYNAATGTATIVINKANQTINWSNPAGIVYGTALSAAQLNATVSVPGAGLAGALTYSPAAGTILNPGPGQVLSVTAAETPNYNTATKTVTINVLYTFIGFLQPIDNRPAVNIGNPGRTYPVKWQLKDASGNYIGSLASVASIQYSPVSCTTFDLTISDVIEAAATGGTVLRYDSTANQFIYNWQTPTASNACYVLTLTLIDGTKHQADFQMKK